ncbi:hypothetical protein [Humisphaera borealis]|uniref:Uncharacterized protein n=1 Tax=Humisphaera borealis TaxID=2807512 RepID=A0A7M2WZ66_9BACT|nr:hypothetical protein [Humisphaera borealis]QOV90798.1 hypothetical protein IPV69_05420 [Humisphaera borealis]
MPNVRNAIRWVATSLVLGVIAFSAIGCAAAGLIAHATTPPPKVPPAYKLAPVPTILLVDFSGNPGQGTLDSIRIAALATGMMRDNGLTFMLDPGLATSAQSSQPLDKRLRPSELARACGAKQFIYIDLRRYTTTSSMLGETASGQAEAAVWVVDAQTAEVLWPPESGQGFPIGASVPFTPTTGGTTEQLVHDQINQQIAQKSGRLFFEWQEQ